MREFLKGTLCVVVLAGFVVSAFAWIDDRPNQQTWLLRLGGLAISLLALGLFCKVHFRRDIAPDFLHQFFGVYFDCGGFCFVVQKAIVDELFYLLIYFQNRYDRPCLGRITLYPQKKLLQTQELSPLHAEIECGPASVGVSSIPMAVPKMSQGCKQDFDISATANYPEGRGRMLRFRVGAKAEYHTPFRGKVRAVIAILSALTLHYHYHKPATISLHLPLDVLDELPEGARQITETLWNLGDPSDLRLKPAPQFNTSANLGPSVVAQSIQ